jgi:hypothetical protein
MVTKSYWVGRYDTIVKVKETEIWRCGEVTSTVRGSWLCCWRGFFDGHCVSEGEVGNLKVLEGQVLGRVAGVFETGPVVNCCFVFDGETDGGVCVRMGGELGSVLVIDDDK